MANKLYILVCAYFIRDVKAALARIEDSEDVEVISFPADCGRPQLSTEDITSLTPETDDSSEILVLGNVCIGDEKNNPSNIVSRQFRHFEQCFHIICPPEIVNQYLIKGDYLLSPGWLSGWNKNISKWGFNGSDAKDFFKNTVNKLRLLDTKINHQTGKQLQKLSENVDIPAKTVAVGLDYLCLLLEKEIKLWRERNASKTLTEQQQLVSNYIMSYELISRLHQSSSEAEIIEGILELFIILFAPKEIVYVPLIDGKPGEPVTHASQPDVTEDILDDIPEFINDYCLCNNGCGFWLALMHNQSIFGMLKINRVAMPQYLRSYLNQANNLSSVCALLIENARIQRTLIDTAHLTGKAELAIEVLHNIGNVITSIGISASFIREQLNDSVCSRIPDVVQLLEQHKENLEDFIINDPRGKKIPAFFSALNREYSRQHEINIIEIERLISNIEQIKGIIRSQQAYSSDSNIFEKISCTDLFSEAITPYLYKLEQFEIDLEKDFAKTGLLLLPKYKLLQIIGNLVTNAIDSLAASNIRPRKLQLKVRLEGGNLLIQVTDNGIGIGNDDLVRVFQHGYTSKEDHSGFGLHSVSNLMTEIGGKLSVTSEGKNKGVTFMLTLPVREYKNEA